MIDKNIEQYLEKLPPYLHEYFKLWYFSVDENGNRMGYLKFAKTVGRSHSTVRRWIRKFRKLLYGTEHPFPTAEELDIHVKHEKEIHLLKEQINVWKRKYTHVLKQLNFEEKFLELAKQMIKALPQPEKPVEIRSEFFMNKRVEENLTLIVSDVHAGEVVSSEETFGFNEYNFNIMIERIRNLFGTVIDIAINKLVGYKFKELNIDFAGDILTGVIHDELMETSDLVVVEAILLSAYVFASAISAVTPYFEKVNLHGVVGNHGRVTKKIRYKRSYNNYDYLFYKLLQVYLAKHKNVTFMFPKNWFLVYENNGYNVCMFHGDSIKTWAGVPWYGIQRAVSKLANLLAKKGIIIDIWQLGHFHQDASIPDNTLINGSLIGPSEFSIKKFYSVAPPSQKLYGCHRDIGITFMYRIRPDIPSNVSIEINPDIYNLVLSSDNGVEL